MYNSLEVISVMFTKWRLGVIAVLLGLLVLSGCGGPSFKGKVQNPVKPAPEFTLTNQDGQPFHIADTRGKIALLYFGYTYCPDICPTTLGDLKRVYNELGADADRVEVIFATVDPERDSAARLKMYLSFFNTKFVGLTGTLDEMQKVYQDYNIVVQKTKAEGSAAGYLVSHTSSVFLIDQAGNLRLAYDHGVIPEDVISDVRTLIKQESAK